MTAMRVRNTSTGTVLNVDENTASRYLASGWVDADAKPARSTRAESTGDDDKPKPRRRKASE